MDPRGGSSTRFWDRSKGRSTDVGVGPGCRGRSRGRSEGWIQADPETQVRSIPCDPASGASGPQMNPAFGVGLFDAFAMTTLAADPDFETVPEKFICTNDVRNLNPDAVPR